MSDPLEVCVPFRPDNGARSASWAFLRARWQQAGFRVIEADSAARGPFSAAQARNRAIERARGPVVLVCDADIRIPIRAAHEALLNATATDEYTVAHDRICWLDENATEKVLAGRKPRLRMGNEEARRTWGACYALPVELWRRAGGFDERFQGWGCQDIAFWFACHTLAGRSQRVENSVAYHLWHEPRFADQRLNPHWRANNLLFERYKQAFDDPAAMQELVKEHEAA